MQRLSRTDLQNELIRFRRPVAHPVVDQKIRLIGGAIANVTRLAWERALAHHDSPNEFPLPPDPHCQERAFYAAFAALPQGDLRRMGKDAAKLLRQPVAARRQVLGDAAELDARSPLSVIAQARSRPVPAALQITRADLEAVSAGQGAHVGAGSAARAAAPPPSIKHARLVAKSIRCLRDSREPGKDEIVLGGFFQTASFDLTTGELSRASLIPNQGVFDVRNLGKFKTDDPPRDLGNLEIESIFLGAGINDFPLMPFVALFLAEKDLFGFGAHMQAFSQGFDINLIAPLASIYFVLVGLAGLAELPTAAAAVVLTQSALLIAIPIVIFALLRILGDDLFNANQLSLLVDSPQFTFPGGATSGDVVTLTYKRRVAHYELDVQWLLDIS